MDQLWTPWRMPYLKGDAPHTDDACLFCAKLTSDDDAGQHVLFRGTHCFVTLNLYPYNNGHLMIVPNQHTGRLEDLPESALMEMMRTTQKALHVLRAAYQPEGFNMGINQGTAAGAGVAEHLHQHIVPRWSGDTNYMTTIGQTRVIPEWIDDMYANLKTLWARQYPNDFADGDQ